MSDQAAGDRRILSASAVMAAGTMVSRFSGYLRNVLLVAALGGLLRHRVRHLEEVRGGHGGQRGRHQAGEPGGEHQPAG